MRHSITTLFVVMIALLMASAAHAEDLITARVVGVADGDSIFGERAKQFTQNLCFGKIVLYRIVGIDIFEQTLAIVSLEDGRELNLALLEAGLAWHLQRHSNRQDYEAAEQEARKAGVGLWAAPDPTPPWEWRQSPPSNGR